MNKVGQSNEESKSLNLGLSDLLDLGAATPAPILQDDVLDERKGSASVTEQEDALTAPDSFRRLAGEGRWNEVVTSCEQEGLKSWRARAWWIKAHRELGDMPQSFVDAPLQSLVAELKNAAPDVPEVREIEAILGLQGMAAGAPFVSQVEAGDRIQEQSEPVAATQERPAKKRLKLVALGVGLGIVAAGAVLILSPRFPAAPVSVPDDIARDMPFVGEDPATLIIAPPEPARVADLSYVNPMLFDIDKPRTGLLTAAPGALATPPPVATGEGSPGGTEVPTPPRGEAEPPGGSRVIAVRQQVEGDGPLEPESIAKLRRHPERDPMAGRAAVEATKKEDLSWWPRTTGQEGVQREGRRAFTADSDSARLEVFEPPKSCELVARADVFSEPVETDHPVSYLYAGDRIEVLAARGGWLKLRSRAGKLGYVRGTCREGLF